MKRSFRRGFTLLELLVVISIIGILIAMGAVAFSTAQSKGRDSKRRGDMKAIQAGFEQYYSANSAYNVTCSTMAVSPYLPGGLPTDPRNTGSNVYTHSCTASTYCSCAFLESDGTGNATDAACAYGSGATADYFCVSNLQ